ncbi:hypothetical protein [Streptomyces pseudovenezuelae]|uniref:DUF4145 domain-containing protein n=1 Tax=Streptomyces pseudovenezuelae TaxID=67350 RepID=A0ABT6M262_9ACTN|nr:hypothetical protein [Streptomyces pseudovenezuelae]MDH6222652.1 hypothetical protein [Streptomyces pseudovenezuelae]
MTALTDPLTEEQQLLLDIAWTTFVEHQRFPHFSHVAHRMRKHGHDATEVLYSFPVIGHDQVTTGYRAVGWWGHGHTPQSDGPVLVTMAGLYHLQHDEMARDLAHGLLAYMRRMTLEQDKILDSPFDHPNVTVNLGDVLKEIDGAGPLLNRMSQIADREWPGMHFNRGTLTGRLGALPAADFDTLDGYLAGVVAHLSPPEPPEALSFTEPRALLRALNFLNVTYELVVGGVLVVPPPMDRSSLLVLDVDDEAAYNSGLVVLTDILRDFKVPGRGPGSGLLRLEEHLSDKLPMIDRDTVHQAVQLLDQIRVIRNSAIHPKPQPELAAAHHALGLRFPVRDFTAAWDSVRAHAERAVSNLQEAIQSARH